MRCCDHALLSVPLSAHSVCTSRGSQPGITQALTSNIWTPLLSGPVMSLLFHHLCCKRGHNRVHPMSPTSRLPPRSKMPTHLPSHDSSSRPRRARQSRQYTMCFLVACDSTNETSCCTDANKYAVLQQICCTAITDRGSRSGCHPAQ